MKSRDGLSICTAFSLASLMRVNPIGLSSLRTSPFSVSHIKNSVPLNSPFTLKASCFMPMAVIGPLPVTSINIFSCVRVAGSIIAIVNFLPVFSPCLRISGITERFSDRESFKRITFSDFAPGVSISTLRFLSSTLPLIIIFASDLSVKSKDLSLKPESRKALVMVSISFWVSITLSLIFNSSETLYPSSFFSIFLPAYPIFSPL